MYRCTTLIVIVFSIFSFPTIAQFNLGVKAGGNVYDNYQTGNKIFVSQPHAGFHAGMFCDYVITGRASARVEALFSTRGLYLTQNQNGSATKYERESSYLDIPVVIQYKIAGNFSIHAGVVPSVFIKEYRSTTLNGSGSAIAGGDEFHSYERFQMGVCAGASYAFELFNRSMEIGARASTALTRTNELVRQARVADNPRYIMFQPYLAVNLFTF